MGMIRKILEGYFRGVNCEPDSEEEIDQVILIDKAEQEIRQAIKDEFEKHCGNMICREFVKVIDKIFGGKDEKD